MIVLNPFNQLFRLSKSTFTVPFDSFTCVALDEGNNILLCSNDAYILLTCSLIFYRFYRFCSRQDLCQVKSLVRKSDF